mgnify:CR=1 FL=1
MSLLLVLFYFVGIPALVIAVAVWLWRKTDSSLARGLVMAGAMATLAGLLWLAQGEKWLADRQVRELCAKDGGVKVYETVRLPAEKFNQWGQPNFYRPDQGENALGAEYIFKQTISYQLQGTPSLHRYHVQVFSRASGKLLGESIGYSRGGGDLPGPWAPSSFSCPDKYGEIPLLTKIFIKSN